MKRLKLLKLLFIGKFKLQNFYFYRCGPLIDLCRGPHVRNTGLVKAISLVKNSSTYWEGKADKESLQRIYGISFPDNKKVTLLKY